MRVSPISLVSSRLTEPEEIDRRDNADENDESAQNGIREALGPESADKATWNGTESDAGGHCQVYIACEHEDERGNKIRRCGERILGGISPLNIGVVSNSKQGEQDDPLSGAEIP